MYICIYIYTSGWTSPSFLTSSKRCSQPSWERKREGDLAMAIDSVVDRDRSLVVCGGCRLDR